MYLTLRRPYDPNTGRFLSRDPVGEVGDPGGNLYAYVYGDPVSRSDVLGLYCWPNPVKNAFFPGGQPVGGPGDPVFAAGFGASGSAGFGGLLSAGMFVGGGRVGFYGTGGYDVGPSPLSVQVGPEWVVSQNYGAFTGPSTGGSISIAPGPVGGSVAGTSNSSGTNVTTSVGVTSPGAGGAGLQTTTGTASVPFTTDVVNAEGVEGAMLGLP